VGVLGTLVALAGRNWCSPDENGIRLSGAFAAQGYLAAALGLWCFVFIRASAGREDGTHGKAGRGAGGEDGDDDEDVVHF
jgi:hypothetical protein